jgi:hypothetical protein
VVEEVLKSGSAMVLGEMAFVCGCVLVRARHSCVFLLVALLVVRETGSARITA